MPKLGFKARGGRNQPSTAVASTHQFSGVPHGIAVEGNQLTVTESFKGRTVILDLDLNYVAEEPTPGVNPYGIVQDVATWVTCMDTKALYRDGVEVANWRDLVTETYDVPPLFDELGNLIREGFTQTVTIDYGQGMRGCCQATRNNQPVIIVALTSGYAVVDVATGAVENRFLPERGIREVCTGDFGKFYAADFRKGTLLEVDVDSGAILERTFYRPSAVWFDGSADELFVLNDYGNLYRIDANGETPIPTPVTGLDNLTGNATNLFLSKASWGGPVVKVER